MAVGECANDAHGVTTAASGCAAKGYASGYESLPLDSARTRAFFGSNNTEPAGETDRLLVARIRVCAGARLRALCGWSSGGCGGGACGRKPPSLSSRAGTCCRLRICAHRAWRCRRIFGVRLRICVCVRVGAYRCIRSCRCIRLRVRIRIGCRLLTIRMRRVLGGEGVCKGARAGWRQARWRAVG